MKISVSDIVNATGGAYIGEDFSLRQIATGLTWDSRNVFPDNAFLAMPGMRVDGNDFIKGAIQRGASVIICTKPPSDNTVAVAGEFACPIVVVDDGIEALEKIAGLWRDTIHAVVIGVTGSTGKTSTKDFLKSVFSQKFKTVATQGNQNNEIGVPATILSADDDTEILIVELGMRGLHQIEHLCSFVKPNIGVITNIGVSHMELLGSRENIARAKAELLEALPHTGIAILNNDDEYTPLLKSIGMLEERGLKVHSYGSSESASVHAKDIKFDSNACANFKAETQAGDITPIELSIPGEHNIMNALAAYSAGLAMGIEPSDIALGLSEAKAGSMRMEIVHANNGITIINDAYNANPDSMRASLCTLTTLDTNGRRVAVLGDMGELGDDEYQHHVDVGTFAAKMNLDMLVCIGTLSLGIKSGALAADMDSSKVKSFPSIEDAQQFLTKYIEEGDLVLIKASRFMELERLIKGIQGA